MVRRKLGLASFALKTSSGIAPYKIMYSSFWKWAAARTELEKEFMRYDTVAAHLGASTDNLMSSEDTYRNNTFLASAPAFYRLIRDLRFDKMDEVIEAMSASGSPIFRSSSISRNWLRNGSFTAYEALVLYLKKRQDVSAVRISKGIPEDERVLRAALAIPDDCNETDLYNISLILDKFFDAPFPGNALQGGVVRDSRDRLELMGIIKKDNGVYRLDPKSARSVSAMLESRYTEITGIAANDVPDHEGLLFVDGRIYRRSANSGTAMDGGSDAKSVDNKASVTDGAVRTHGGIDLRAAGKERIVVSPDKGKLLRRAAMGKDVLDPAREWRMIEAGVRSGAMPYERIRDFYAVCCARVDLEEYRIKVIALVLNSLRYEEEANVPTSVEGTGILTFIS
jgi:hypothetical protein